MSFLSRASAHRPLVLWAAWLILQCVMAGSISQTGMDEFEGLCLRAQDTTNDQSMVYGEQERVVSRSGDWVSKVR